MNATMDKREKVIAGLSGIHAVALAADQLYINHMGMKEFNGLLHDAIDLLEAVKPEIGTADEGGYSTNWYVCGSCLTPIEVGDNYCHECGKAVAWDE